ncbi:MAG: hypothetical protein ACRED0_10300 [Gammaproteobacteria bacterium]
MNSEKNREPWYEVLAKLTPLISSILISGVIGYLTVQSTARLQARQLELTQATSLLEILPKIQSANPSECLAAFEAFNGEDLERRLVDIMEHMLEPCGLPRLKALAKSRHTSPEIKTHAAEALRRIPAWVYLHTACRPGENSCKQDEAGCVLSKRIEDYRHRGDDEGQPFSYRDPRQVGGSAPDRGEIRYFSESERRDADTVREIYQQVIGGEITVKWLPLIGRPGTIEIWMPKTGGTVADPKLIPSECAAQKTS